MAELAAKGLSIVNIIVMPADNVAAVAEGTAVAGKPFGTAWEFNSGIVSIASVK